MSELLGQAYIEIKAIDKTSEGINSAKKSVESGVADSEKKSYSNRQSVAKEYYNFMTNEMKRQKDFWLAFNRYVVQLDKEKADTLKASLKGSEQYWLAYYKYVEQLAQENIVVGKAHAEAQIINDKMVADKQKAIWAESSQYWISEHKKMVEVGKAHAEAQIINDKMVADKQKARLSEQEAYWSKHYKTIEDLQTASMTKKEAALKKENDLYNQRVASVDKLRKSSSMSADELNRIEKGIAGQHKRTTKDIQNGNDNRAVSFKTATMNILKAAPAFALATAAIGVFYAALNGIKDEFISGLKAVEDYRVAVADMAGFLVTFSSKSGDVNMAEMYESAKIQAKELVSQIEILDARTIATGKELTAMVRQFVAGGVEIDLMNKGTADGLVNIANAVKSLTKGQNQEIQTRQEIRALVQGTVKDSNVLMQTLKAIDPEIKKHLSTWKEEGTTIKNVGILLSGMGYAAQDLEDTWSVIGSTLSTIHERILRGAFEPTFNYLISLAKGIQTALMDTNGQLTPLSIGIKDAIKNTMSFIGNLAQITAGVAALAAAIYTLANASAIIAGITTAFAAVAGSPLLIAAGLVTAGAAVTVWANNTLNEIKEVKYAFEGISFGDVKLGSVSGVDSDMFGNMSESLSDIRREIQTPIDNSFVSYLDSEMANFGSDSVDRINEIKKEIETPPTNSFVDWLIEQLALMVIEGKALLVGLFTGDTYKLIIYGWEMIINRIKFLFIEMFNDIKEITAQFWEKIGSSIPIIGEGVGSSIASAFRSIKIPTEELNTRFDELIPKTLKIINGMMGIKDQAGETKKEITNFSEELKQLAERYNIDLNKAKKPITFSEEQNDTIEVIRKETERIQEQNEEYGKNYSQIAKLKIEKSGLTKSILEAEAAGETEKATILKTVVAELEAAAAISDRNNAQKESNKTTEDSAKAHKSAIEQLQQLAGSIKIKDAALSQSKASEIEAMLSTEKWQKVLKEAGSEGEVLAQKIRDLSVAYDENKEKANAIESVNKFGDNLKQQIAAFEGGKSALQEHKIAMFEASLAMEKAGDSARYTTEEIKKMSEQYQQGLAKKEGTEFKTDFSSLKQSIMPDFENNGIEKYKAQLDEISLKYQNLSEEAKTHTGITQESFDQLYAQLELRQNQWLGGAVNGLQQYAQEAGNQFDEVSNLMNQSMKGMEDAIVNFVKTGKLNFSSLVDMILDGLIRMAVQMTITANIAQALNSILGSFGSGGTFTSTGYTGDVNVPSGVSTVAANGKAFDNGIQKFANGGTFTNSIVTKPTLFKFAKGTGLMGEAGPEAIMPLERASNGKLGVSVSGIGKSAPITNVIINNNSSKTTTRTEEKQNSAGGKDITVIIEEIVGNSIMSGRGKINKAMRSTFGASPILAGR